MKKIIFILIVQVVLFTSLAIAGDGCLRPVLKSTLENLNKKQRETIELIGIVMRRRDHNMAIKGMDYREGAHTIMGYSAIVVKRFEKVDSRRLKKFS